MASGDVRLFQTVDGGDISITGGLVEFSGGLDTAVYLSLFGGNADDSGQKDSPATWWGNLGETVLERQYTSETGYLLRAIAATSANLLRVEAAITRDLAWLVDGKIASAVDVVARIPAMGRVSITVTITADGVETDFNFTENWEAST